MFCKPDGCTCDASQALEKLIANRAHRLCSPAVKVNAVMAETLEEVNQGLNHTLKDLFAGAVGGVAQVLIGTQSMKFQ